MSKIPSWKTWAILASLFALMGWLFAPMPEFSASLVQSRRDDWSLAALPRRFDQSSLAVGILSASQWGATTSSAPTAEVPVQDPRWRIAAVFGKGDERGVLIVFEAADKSPQRLMPGDTLPSGHRIESIGERDVCVRIGKRTYKLGVETRE